MILRLGFERLKFSTSKGNCRHIGIGSMKKNKETNAQLLLWVNYPTNTIIQLCIFHESGQGPFTIRELFTIEIYYNGNRSQYLFPKHRVLITQSKSRRPLTPLDRLPDPFLPIGYEKSEIN